MKKTATLLAAAILPLVASLGIATSSFAQSRTTPAPLTELDQSADATYCQLLANLYQASDDDNPIIDAAVQEAINLCNKGNTAAGIPVLEQALAYDKVTLPPGGVTP